MADLLLIDDEPAIRHAFSRVFREPAFTLRTAETAADGVRMLLEARPDVVILDVHLPDATRLETFERIRGIDPRIPTILITGHGTTDLAIEAIKLGAFDYLLKPLELSQLRELIDRAVAMNTLIQTTAASERKDEIPEKADALVGRCAAIQEVYKAIGRVAAQNVTVLILGESGTGKELVARAIFQHSARVDRPFLAINCGAIPETLLESELFGHERGAFTGADRKRVGKFEQCNGGTLFLDEVGDMTPLTQTKVLRVIQEQQFERVGGNEPIQTDVRLIAATNANLETLAAAGRFRGDLFYRLSVFTIRLPPLRERGDDLILLVDYYLRLYGRELGKEGRVATEEALELLKAYPWPGNVRELQSVLKQGLLKTHGPLLQAESLPEAIQSPGKGSLGTSSDDWESFFSERVKAGTEDLYAESVGRMERFLIPRILQQTGGNQLQAARVLGITRGSLRNKTRALNITISKSVESPDDMDD